MKSGLVDYLVVCPSILLLLMWVVVMGNITSSFKQAVRIVLQAFLVSRPSNHARDSAYFVHH